MGTELFSSIPHKTKNKSEGPKTEFNSITITSKNPKDLSQTAAGFYVFYHLGSDPYENNKKWRNQYKNRF